MHYSNRTRGYRKQHGLPANGEAPDPLLGPAARAPMEVRRSWACLIRQVYEVEPLLCPQCGGTMKVIAVIERPAVIRQIRSAELATKPRPPGPPHRSAPSPRASRPTRCLGRPPAARVMGDVMGDVGSKAHCGHESGRSNLPYYVQLLIRPVGVNEDLLQQSFRSCIWLHARPIADRDIRAAGGRVGRPSTAALTAACRTRSAPRPCPPRPSRRTQGRDDPC